MKQDQKYTVDQLREIFTYSPETGDLMWTGQTHRRPKGVVCGSLNKEGYMRVLVDKNEIFCHRIAWALHFGEWPQGQIDHINRNPADNRIANLRVVTGSQNCMNRAMANRHGLSGVARLPHGRWQAQSAVGGRVKYLGSFDTKEAAHQAYVEHVSRTHAAYLPKELP